MDRRALLVAAVAAGAILAFGVGAATLDDALADASPVPDGGESAPGDSPGGGDPPADAGGGSPACDACGSGLGITLSVADLFPTIPATASFALAGVGLAVLAVLWYRAGGGTAGSLARRDGHEDGVRTAPDSGGIGRHAIEDPPADNAVYRAWWALVTRVDDRDPATTTPGEYAAAARERGLPARSVSTLTTLFERVRYGEGAVTDDRAERARRAADSLPEEP